MDITSYILGKKAGGGGPALVLQDKEVEITENGETTITADSGYDGLRSVDVDTNVQPDLETKSITITENTTTTITPTIGKDGLSSVEITTNVPSQKFAFIGGGGFSFFGDERSDLQGEIDNIVANVDTSSITSMASMFYMCASLTSLDLSDFNTSNVNNTSQMFGYCISLVKIDMRSFDFTNISSYGNIFGASVNNGVPNNCEIIVADDTQKQWITSKFSRLKNVKTVAEYEGS